MAIKTEQRLKKIEDMLKDLKATYMVYGGAMKLYETASPTYTNSQFSEAVIRFNPNFITSQDIIVASVQYELTDSQGVFYSLSQYASIDPQDGNNYLIFRVPALSGSFQIKIVSTVPGTFTRIS